MYMGVCAYLIESTVKGTTPTVRNDDLDTSVTISTCITKIVCHQTIESERNTDFVKNGDTPSLINSRASIVAQSVHFLSFLIRNV